MRADGCNGAGAAPLVRELAVIREWLAEAGLLSEVNFSMRLHRRRFEDVRRTSRWTSGVKLQHILGIPELRDLMAAFAPLRRTATAAQETWTALTRRKIYVAGGESDWGGPLGSAEAFDPRAGSWEPVRQMPVKRAAGAGALLGGRLYICGGAGPFAGTVTRFDLAGDRWEVQESMLEKRSQHAAAVLNGRLYVCGGVDGSAETRGLAHSSAERFDPEGGRRGRGSWEVIPSMLEPRRGLALAALGGQLRACGGGRGWDLSIHPPERSTEIFDPFVGVWTPAPPMLERRLLPAFATVGARLHLCGGVSGDNREALRSAERFDPARGVWEALPPMPVARYAAAAASADGKLFVFGGKSFPGFGHGYPNELRHSTGDCFDPRGGAWERVRPMADRRANPVALSVLF